MSLSLSQKTKEFFLSKKCLRLSFFVVLNAHNEKRKIQKKREKERREGRGKEEREKSHRSLFSSFLGGGHFRKTHFRSSISSFFYAQKCRSRLFHSSAKKDFEDFI